ncbi:poly-beta-1,6-N-acetyl-D-glucosamine biosynthesis protein PgaD [Bacillus sp. FJAT-29814]|uniref:poly-beta-1,6-N-acetyl-D-glucosamine biosynthesis protein PgaD n=1 Tax=Bacillus sp. FJAT-29814 TaxID=1729688 RepID=UPI0008318ED4|nr:poly-beta-1,6-N-acetyl-D-glucosamine biosynthesis protein PgaD [Bacillus sp. FJAT-29814]
MIIKVQQSRIRTFIEFLITLFGWFFLLLFLYNVSLHFQTRLNYRFYLLNLSNTNSIMLFTFFSFAIATGSMMWWSSYNKRKYGPLKRRKFPLPTDNQEISAYFQISEEDVKRNQDSRYVEKK